MYLFNRSATLDRHHLVEATGAAVEIAGMVTQISGLPVSVFMSRYGAPLNAVRWSTRVESQADLQVAIEKCLADDGYLEWIGTHTDLFETAPSDQLSKVVSSSLTPEPKRFYAVLSAVAVAGKQAEAMAYGVRAQQFVAESHLLAERLPERRLRRLRHRRLDHRRRLDERPRRGRRHADDQHRLPRARQRGRLAVPPGIRHGRPHREDQLTRPPC